jgi:hypothetical protein
MTVWEELIVYFPLTLHRPPKEQPLQQFFVAVGTYLPSRCLAKIGGYTDPRLSFDKTRTVQKTTLPTIFLFLRVFFAAGTCLQDRCLETIHIQTHRLMGEVYEVSH